MRISSPSNNLASHFKFVKNITSNLNWALKCTGRELVLSASTSWPSKQLGNGILYECCFQHRIYCGNLVWIWMGPIWSAKKCIWQPRWSSLKASLINNGTCTSRGAAKILENSQTIQLVFQKQRSSIQTILTSSSRATDCFSHSAQASFISVLQPKKNLQIHRCTSVDDREKSLHKDTNYPLDVPPDHTFNTNHEGNCLN